MISVPSLFFLSFTVFTTYLTVCTGLKCYECSGLSQDPCIATPSNCPMCTVSRNDDDPTKFDRACCWWGCGSPNEVTEHSGRLTYFCNTDECNGPESEAQFSHVTYTTTTTITPTTTTITKSTFYCYDCSGSNCGTESSPASTNCPRCMVYRNPKDQSIIERRCCWWACGAPNTVSMYEGVETYFCADDKCNGYGSEQALSPPVFTTTTTVSTTQPITTTTATTTTPPKSIVQCYDCSGPSCGADGSPMSNNCPRCMIYRNPKDQSIIERRCCWWACGAPNTVGMYEGVETYFCADDKCNGYGSEQALSPPVFTTTTTVSTTQPITTTTATTTTPPKSIVQCYDCSGPSCGVDGSPMSNNCPRCMIYRNPKDQSIIERRCCWWACGAPNTVSMYEGVETYFCADDKCNGYGSEQALSPAVTLTTTTTGTTTMTTTSMTTTAITTTVSTTPPKTSFQCYDCSGTSCGSEGSPTVMNCPTCMVYRNPVDETIIERRCCWWACGASNTVGMYNGRETYFCAADKCNGFGVEYVLKPPITTTTVATVTSSVISTMTTTVMTTTAMTTTSMTTTAITTTVSTTPPKTSFQCYDCSGASCGSEGSATVMNCPTCMVYRNPVDETIIERRCCWWACGASNTVGMYNGRETYFCAADKCNGFGVEYVLKPPVTTTTLSTMSSASSTSSEFINTTSSPTGCILNCKNGGTPETEDGCFCYCPENTSGTECENIDCAQPDVSPEICSIENQILCEESETFAFECLHLCGKC